MEFSVETLRRTLNVPDSKSWNKVLHDVIDPAILEINNITDIGASYIPATCPSHTTESLIFTIEQKSVSKA